MGSRRASNKGIAAAVRGIRCGARRMPVMNPSIVTAARLKEAFHRRRNGIVITGALDGIVFSARPQPRKDLPPLSYSSGTTTIVLQKNK